MKQKPKLKDDPAQPALFAEPPRELNTICCHPGCKEFGPYGYGSLKRPETVRRYCGKHRPAE